MEGCGVFKRGGAEEDKVDMVGCFGRAKRDCEGSEIGEIMAHILKHIHALPSKEFI